MKATLLVVKLPISASWECLLVATRLVSRTSQAHLVETSEKSKSLPATICQVKTSTDSTGQDWHSPGKYLPPWDQLLSDRPCVSWFGAGWWIARTLGDTFDSHEQRDPAIKTSLAPTLLIKIRWRLERNCWTPFHVWEWSKVWFIHESKTVLLS